MNILIFLLNNLEVTLFYLIFVLSNKINNTMPKQIQDWSADEVTKIFDYHLDDMHPLDRVKVREKYTTTESKRAFLLEEEKKFKNYFK